MARRLSPRSMRSWICWWRSGARSSQGPRPSVHVDYAGVVAADDPHLGVFAQPGGGGVRDAVCKGVAGAVSVRVHEDRCVGTTTAHGELVDAQIRDRLRQQNGWCVKEAGLGVLAGGDGCASSLIGSGTSARKQGSVSELGVRTIVRRVSTHQIRFCSAPDTAGRSSARAWISVRVPDRRSTPPGSAQRVGPRCPLEPLLRPPPQRGDAHQLLIVVHAQIGLSDSLKPPRGTV